MSAPSQPSALLGAHKEQLFFCFVFPLELGHGHPADAKLKQEGKPGPALLMMGIPGGSDGKESACNAGDPGSVPGLGGCPGEGRGHPLQCSYLETPRDRGAQRATVHGVARSRTRLSDFTFTSHLHALEKEMATHSSVLAWRIPGMGSLVGYRLWGRTELDMTEVT